MKNTNQTQPFDDVKKEIQELKDELERIHYAGTIGLRQEYEKAKPALDSLKFLLQMNKSSSKDEQQDFQHQINSLTEEFFKLESVTSMDKEYIDKEFDIRNCLDGIKNANTDIMTFTRSYIRLLKLVFNFMEDKCKDTKNNFYPEIIEFTSDTIKTNTKEYPHIKIIMKFNGYASITYNIVDLHSGDVIETLTRYGLDKVLYHLFDLYGIVMNDRRVTVIPFIKKEALDESTFREVHTLVENVSLMLIQAGIEVNIENTILNKE